MTCITFWDIFLLYFWDCILFTTKWHRLTLGLKIGSFGLPLGTTFGCFFWTFSDRVIFWESCSRAGESSQNKVPGSSELHETLIKSDLAGGPVLGHIFFEQRCQHGWPLMISYQFWGPPGEPTGGPTNDVFQFWKHCWDQMAPIPTQGPPKGPQGPKKSPPGSPRPQQIIPPHRLSLVLCGVLTSFVKLFLHEIPCHTSSVYIPSPLSAASL